MDATLETTYSIGLRFKRADAGKLLRTADLLRTFDAEAVGLLTRAYEAATTDGLLIIECSDPAEAIKVADDFPKRWGLPRPAVDVLTHP